MLQLSVTLPLTRKTTSLIPTTKKNPFWIPIWICSHLSVHLIGLIMGEWCREDASILQVKWVEAQWKQANANQPSPPAWLVSHSSRSSSSLEHSADDTISSACFVGRAPSLVASSAEVPRTRGQKRKTKRGDKDRQKQMQQFRRWSSCWHTSTVLLSDTFDKNLHWGHFILLNDPKNATHTSHEMSIVLCCG